MKFKLYVAFCAVELNSSHSLFLVHFFNVEKRKKLQRRKRADAALVTHFCYRLHQHVEETSPRPAPRQITTSWSSLVYRYVPQTIPFLAVRCLETLDSTSNHGFSFLSGKCLIGYCALTPTANYWTISSGHVGFQKTNCASISRTSHLFEKFMFSKQSELYSFWSLCC